MGRKNLPRRAASITLDVYAECRRCQFWVASGDGQCPDCGVRKPCVTQSQVNNHTALLSTAVALAAFFIVRNITGGLTLPALFAAIAPGGISAFLIKRHYERASSSCLRASEDLIKQRMEENGKREAQIARVAEVEEHTAGELDARYPAQTAGPVITGDLFASAVEMLQNRRDRYRAKLMDIEMVRWANALAPFKDRLNDLSEEETTRCLEVLDYQRRAGDTLRFDWKQRQATENAFAPEAQMVVKRLTETMAACEQLRETLLLRQALGVVRGVSPLEEELHAAHVVPPEVELALREPDVFSARVAVEDFNVSLAELEAEHKRLSREEELASSFRRVIERR